MLAPDNITMLAQPTVVAAPLPADGARPWPLAEVERHVAGVPRSMPRLAVTPTVAEAASLAQVVGVPRSMPSLAVTPTVAEAASLAQLCH
jgi:hypothetical protein